MRRSLVAQIVAVMLTTACDSTGPTAPEPPVHEALPALDAGSLSAASADAGVMITPPAIQALLDAAFTFLPPLPARAISGEFDSGLLAHLVLDVCEPDTCGYASLASYTSATGDGAETLRLDEGLEHFIVNWKPESAAPSSTGMYRLRVLAAGLELGRIDVQLVISQSELKAVTAAGGTALRDDRTLPVKFAVNRNPVLDAWLLAADDGTAGAVAALLKTGYALDASETVRILAFVGFAAGDVAGALREPLGLTAAAAAALLGDAGLVADALEAAIALVGGGYEAADVLATLKDAYGQSASGIAATAFATGIAAADAGSALSAIFDASPTDAARALHDAGYTVVDVGGWLLSLSDAPETQAVAAMLRVATYSIGDVAVFLEVNGIASIESMAIALRDAGFSLNEIADWLVDGKQMALEAAAAVLRALEQPTGDIGAWLLGRGASAGEAAQALKDGGFAVADIAGFLAGLGHTAAEAAPILREIGATAFEVSSALVSEFEQTVQEVSTQLQANGFTAEEAFDAVYRTGVEVLANPADFALAATLAAMKGAGYFFDDLSDALRARLHEWAQENVLDALGLSGFATSDLVPFMIDVMGLSVQHVMERAQAWGVPLDDIVDALVATGATVDEIVAGAIAAYDATMADLGQALVDAGATAYEIGVAVTDAYDQTVEQVGALFHQIGVAGELAFDALYRIGRRLENPPELALHTALAVMEGSGYFFEDFSAALRDGLHEWTQDNLIDGLGLSGFAISDLASFLLDAMGMTVQHVAEFAERWGVPVEDLIGALAAAGAATDEIVAWSVAVYELSAAELATAMAGAGQDVAVFADAMMHTFAGLSEEAAAAALRTAGYASSEVGDWLLGRLALGGQALEDAARMLAGAGYLFDDVADWVWARSGHAVDHTAAVLRSAGYSAQRAADFLVNKAGRAKEVVFGALKNAGYAAADAAEAMYLETGATLVEIGAWLSEFYALTSSQTLDILQAKGATLNQLIAVLFGVYGATLESTIELLVTYGYSAADIVLNWPAG